MSNSASPPDDYAYTWESVGPGYRCEFCVNRQEQQHAWRAHSQQYGDVYVCPRHRHHIQTGFLGERNAVWLALRARKMRHE